MSQIFRLTPLLFLLTSGIASAQGFTISASPATRSVSAGQKATFTVSVLPTDGFDASVFLRVASSTLNSASVVLAPLTLDSGTFATGATLTLSPTQSDLGFQRIVVEGRNGPLTVYDTVELTVTSGPNGNPWVIYHTGNSGLQSVVIQTTAFDRSGATWIGTDRGLARAEPGQAPQTVPGPFESGTATAMVVDSSNTLWVVGAPNGGRLGLMRYQNGDWINVPIPMTHQSTVESTTDMAAAPDGSIWFANRPDGILRLKDSTWTEYGANDWGSSGIISVPQLAVSSEGDLWALIHGTTMPDVQFQIVRFDGTFWRVYNPADFGFNEHSHVVRMAAADSNRVWVVRDRTVVSPRTVGHVSLTLPARGVDIAGGRDGRLWVHSLAPDGGLMFHTPSDTGWQSYRLESSAVSSTVRDISVHNNGSVWVATQRGLAVLWPDADTGSVAGGGTSNVEASDRTLPRSLISITPNPLGSSGSLSLATKGGTARITLHDNLGREVVTLFDGVLEPGQRTLPIDLSTLPAGAYRLSVAIEGRSPATRMIVVSR